MCPRACACVYTVWRVQACMKYEPLQKPLSSKRRQHGAYMSQAQSKTRVSRRLEREQCSFETSRVLAGIQHTSAAPPRTPASSAVHCRLAGLCLIAVQNQVLEGDLSKFCCQNAAISPTDSRTARSVHCLVSERQRGRTSAQPSVDTLVRVEAHMSARRTM